jgi:serine/threonine protein kinase
MHLNRGDRLGPYEIVSSIGKGGMGEVWKARDTRLDRIVAIKTSAAAFSERFEREARAVAALNHPNICTLHDVGPNYLVMEYVEGTPLKGPLSSEESMEYGGQILEALDVAHRKGIIHRDLKPANVLVTKQGIKLLDFGLAKQAKVLREGDATVTQALTQEGQIVGTLQYMSPEQVQGKDTDARSDLFAFGCVLYEMLTGKRAFEGENAASVIAAILEREPAPTSARPPLERVVRRALAKDPDQRFQTARDLKAALMWATEQPASSTAVKPSRRWPWVAAAALAIGALVGWSVGHFQRPSAHESALRLPLSPPEGGRFLFGTNGGGLAISPDGRTTAYVASSNGSTGLWLRPFDVTAARLVEGTAGAAFPFWSPDDRSVAFFAAGKLQRVEVSGGIPVTICEVAVGRGGAWGSDGSIVFGTLGSGLFQVAASGGAATPLTTPDIGRGEVSHRWPQMLPTGRFLYWVESYVPENTGVYAASLAKPGARAHVLATPTNALYATAGDGKSYLLWLYRGVLAAREFNPATLQFAGEPRTVADSVAGIGSSGQMNVAVSAGGLLLYSGSRNASQFTWFERAGKPLGTLGEPGDYAMTFP